MEKHVNGLIKWEKISGSNGSDNLVLFLHGMDSNPKKIEGLIHATKEEINSVRILVPSLAFGWNKHFDFRELALAILLKLDDEIESHLNGQYKRVYIVGHSAGGVLAQVIYILSQQSGRTQGLARLEPGQIQLVLLASISRGWQISHHLPLTHKIAWSIGLLFMMPSHFIAEITNSPMRESWLMQLRRGSPLITWLRLNWLKLGDRYPSVIQLLGSKDEIVSWRDMVDNATAEQTIFFDVPYSDHSELVEFDNEQYGQARATIFRKALQPALTPPGENEYRIHSYENNEVNPILPWDEEPVKPDPKVKRVVFVIHGIRDEGHWTQKIANRARAIFNQDGQGTRDQIAVETSSYGYFSMLQFLLPWERWKKVLWLLDEYVEARRRYPMAKFSYIGHSHGTFIIAKALSKYEDVVFERIAFAGSVVNRNYPWSKLLDQGRVGNVLNFSASSDWVVGIFPKIAQIKPIGFLMGQVLGSAGSEPFKASETDKRVNNNEYVKGSHGAAIEEDNWDNLARFVICNEIPAEDTIQYQKKPSFLFKGCMAWVTCVGGWALAIFLGLFWLPSAVFKAPDLFWGTCLGVVLLAVFVVASIHPKTRGKSLEDRKRMKKKSLLILGTIFACEVLFLLVLPCWPSSFLPVFFESIGMARIQMLSIVVYFFTLWTVLTKV